MTAPDTRRDWFGRRRRRDQRAAREAAARRAQEAMRMQIWAVMHAAMQKPRDA